MGGLRQRQHDEHSDVSGAASRVQWGQIGRVCLRLQCTHEGRALSMHRSDAHASLPLAWAGLRRVPRTQARCSFSVPLGLTDGWMVWLRIEAQAGGCDADGREEDALQVVQKHTTAERDGCDCAVSVERKTKEDGWMKERGFAGPAGGQFTAIGTPNGVVIRCLLTSSAQPLSVCPSLPLCPVCRPLLYNGGPRCTPRLRSRCHPRRTFHPKPPR